MTCSTTFNTILIVSFLTPLSAYAQESIFRCNSETGSAVFTDVPCAYEKKCMLRPADQQQSLATLPSRLVSSLQQKKPAHSLLEIDR